MDTRERSEILDLLERGRDAVSEAVSGVTEEMARRSPGPGRWSILECAEHIVLSEDYLFAQIGAASRCDPPVVNLEREARMLARGADRSRRIESPPEGHPTGAYPTLQAAVERFLASRERTIEFVRSNCDDLRAVMTWHPVLREANCQEMLISMGVHVLRHVKQIEEIKAQFSVAQGEGGA